MRQEFGVDIFTVYYTEWRTEPSCLVERAVPMWWKMWLSLLKRERERKLETLSSR
jgi:hypothetical protein